MKPFTHPSASITTFFRLGVSTHKAVHVNKMYIYSYKSKTHEHITTIELPPDKLAGIIKITSESFLHEDIDSKCFHGFMVVVLAFLLLARIWGGRFDQLFSAYLFI